MIGRESSFENPAMQPSKGPDWCHRLSDLLNYSRESTMVASPRYRALSLVLLALFFCAPACNVFDPGLLDFQRSDGVGDGDGQDDGGGGDGGAGMMDGGGGADAGDTGPLCVETDEVCNGEDDDCDGRVDEGGDVACEAIILNATTACVQGSCVLKKCFENYFNCDGKLVNGCEPCPDAGNE